MGWYGSQSVIYGQCSWLVGWLVDKMSPFSTKIGYIGDKVLIGDLAPSA